MRHTKYAVHLLVSVLLGLLTIYAAFSSKATERVALHDSVFRIDSAGDTPEPSKTSAKQPSFVVAHLGDSHVQAGYFSAPIRQFYHQRYGSAGYGWLSPHRIAGTNQNENYSLSASPVRWRSTRITSNLGYDQTGPGGLLLYPKTKQIGCSIQLRDGSSFRRLLVYRTATAPPLLPGESYQYELLRADSAVRTNIVADTLCFATPLSSVNLLAQGCKPSDGYAGFKVLEDKNGCTFDEIGNNGAMYLQYATEEYTRSLALLNPDVLIVSLGTNESMGRSFSASAFSAQVDNFFQLVRKHLPNSRIVITTPPPSYRTSRVKTGTKRQRISKKGKKARYRTVPVYKTVYSLNRHVEEISNVLRQYATEHEYICIDLYSLMLANDNGQSWIDQGLYARDRVHFSIAGYKKQGEIVAHALQKVL